MTADRLHPTAHQAAEPPADPRPAWERVAYTWLEREVDGGHQVDPAALAAEVSVTPRLATDLVRVLRAQRQRDPGLSELRGRLVRDRITDAYLVGELRGGTPLDPAAVAAHPAGRPVGRSAACCAAHQAGQPRPANPGPARGVAGRLRRRWPSGRRAGRSADGRAPGAH